MTHPTSPPGVSWLTAALALLLATTSVLGAQNQPAPPPLGEAATEALAARFADSKHWVQKVVILLSLNQHWHPTGSTMIVQALRDRDKRLRAYAAEALLRAEQGLLPSIASAELIEELIKQLSQSNKHYKSRILEALDRIAPNEKSRTKSQWASWWRASKKGYEPEPWTAKVIAKDGNNTVAFAERAFDLYNSGLDLGICIDSTGSMQPSIDAVSAALGEMIEILDGISPKLRLGIVHYKEIGDFGDSDRKGAQAILPLTKNISAARQKLLKLKAGGGGDLPEQVANGIEIATGRRLKWQHDANKVVIVIGDAPPQDSAKAIENAKIARNDPGSLTKAPTTGPRSRVKPFMTSTIGVRLNFPPQARVPIAVMNGQREMRETFQKIAEAGGGVFAEIVFDMEVDKKGQLAPKNSGKAGGAARQMVEHILALSFGQQFEREMRDFVKIYYDFKAAKFFK